MELFNNRETELAILIEKHRNGYYTGTYDEDVSPIPDNEYDELEKELYVLNPNHELFNKIGSNINNTIIRDILMLSVEKTFNVEELTKWFNRKDKKDVKEYISSEKMDGLAVELKYNANNELGSAITRGDGESGEDVINNVLNISAIPKKIDTDLKVDSIIVRGEIYMPIQSFKDYLTQNPKITSNTPRNLANGLLHNSNYNLSSWLTFKGYKLIINNQEFYFDTYETELLEIKKMGFPIIEYKKITPHDIGNFESYYKEYINIRSQLPYEIDGIVLRINENKISEKLGNTSQFPRCTACIKFPAEKAITILKDIEFSMSRNGVLTPVAIFNPVVLNGATITRASLHNISNIIKLNAIINQELTVVRSGDVIPKIIKGVDKSIQDITNAPLNFLPKKCPYCDSELKLIKSDKDILSLKCINKQCYKQISKQIEHWCKENDILGFGEAYLDKLVQSKCINSIIDFLNISAINLSINLGITIEFGIKLRQEIDNKIIRSSIINILSGLGIPDFSRNSIKKCKNLLTSIQEIININPEELKLKLGNCATNSIIEWFAANKEILLQLDKKLMIMYITPDNINLIKNTNMKFSNQKICITGTLSHPREYFKELIESYGGIIVDSITKETSLLLIGDKAGSKLEKAKQKNIKIINEIDFFELIK